MNHNVKIHEEIKGHCLPGYEHVKGYYNENGTYVKGHCRKFVVPGRKHALVSGLARESKIWVDDVLLTGETLIDDTPRAEKNARKIENSARHVSTTMQEQNIKKDTVRKSYDNE